MALVKNVICECGVETKYHIITHIKVDILERKVRFDVGHYPTQLTRMQYETPVEESHYTVKEDDYFLTIGGNWQEQCYNYLKSLEEWKDATSD